MTKKNASQTLARELQEVTGAAYSECLRMVQDLGEAGARARMKEWADAADAELKAKGLK
jgi:hypothetical protein